MMLCFQYERQMAKEETVTLTDKLDKDWKSISMNLISQKVKVLNSTDKSMIIIDINYTSCALHLASFELEINIKLHFTQL